MRTLRLASVVFAIVALTVGSSMSAVATSVDGSGPINHVAGSVAVDLVPGGNFDVEDRVFRYRDYPISGSLALVSDPRFYGGLTGSWNWDIPASGAHPIPAWGHMTIAGDDGAWTGSFTGIQRSDFEPVEVRAFLVGEGDYEGLCATLDIMATRMTGGDTWHLDGVVHPLPMAG